MTTKAEAGARIQDIADGCIPVYTVDLLKLAQRDIDLATTEPSLDGVLPRRMTATALIARNVFDAVTDHLWRLYEAGTISAEEMVDKGKDPGELTEKIHRAGGTVGRTELDAELAQP